MKNSIQHVLFASYGNDSLALIQWAHDQGLEGVVVAYSDTGWSSPAWDERVTKCEAWVQSLGFGTVRIQSEGMEALVRRKKGWPYQRSQFCTTELKIIPAQKWLDANDPDKEAICYVGVRREESANRADWPEWTEESDKHGGRSLHAPLVRLTELQRNVLLAKTGFKPLPHRSKECDPCVNENREGICQISEKRIIFIERLEVDLGHTSNGKPRTFFRPHRHKGAVGIREMVRWAKTGGNYNPDQDDFFLGSGAGCDSGMCGG